MNGLPAPKRRPVKHLDFDLLTVTQNAQDVSQNRQSRTFTYDGLGRMTQEVNPESGTTTYGYDSDSSGNCGGTFNGDLVYKKDAVGNIICSTYDAVHRVLSKTYPAGSYASVTPEKHYVYDSASVNGCTISNAATRLAEAYTGERLPES